MKKASSMIELIIAIVIMGIAVMTLPLMLGRTQANNAFALQQEAILATKTHLGDIVTFPWDENSLQGDGVAVLDTNSTDPRYSRTGDENISRIGHVRQRLRRKFFGDINPDRNASVIGVEAVDSVIDIDDFDNTNANLTQATGLEIAGALDYRYDLNMTTRVRYVDDNFTQGNTFTFPITGTTNNTTNIKMIEVTMQADDSLSQFVLRAYSSNIGGSLIDRREFQ